ncbi:hypothetical protein PRIPAC_85771 [Pristionchus pacificus]|uniref:Uncharacterized protein n=1 Tax=Pristionchus pacificus TaxID=54126 RepID=A0A2A6BSD1_PRIPA|nr:hypothetical protein PRIPAC_85771 [Pristionchus pacificus]|eukprot:PDM68849.1 hypothetical protein PRIPAC_47151 [Pristionchus pacificus]
MEYKGQEPHTSRRPSKREAPPLLHRDGRKSCDDRKREQMKEKKGKHGAQMKAGRTANRRQKRGKPT